MKTELMELLVKERASLHSCPSCPVKGSCVFATPAYEPGYCLHEYRLLHAFVAQRLRVHPPAGVQRFERIAQEARAFIDRIRTERPYGGLRCGHEGRPMAPVPFPIPSQTTLGHFVLA